jgi:hypothetical protein
MFTHRRGGIERSDSSVQSSALLFEREQLATLLMQ